METTIKNEASEVRTINFEPSDFNVCLEIPKRLQEYRNAVEHKTKGGVIMPDSVAKRLNEEYLSKTLFYQIIKTGKEVKQYKVGDCILLFDRPKEIHMEEEPNFLMVHEGEIQGKLIYPV